MAENDPISTEDRARRLRDAIATLEAIVEDRTILADVPEEERVALLQAAGRLSRPTRHEQQRATKAFRVITHSRKKAHDRDLRAATEIRAARRAEVFEAPTRVLGMEGAVGELTTPRDCYVCKTEFRNVHPFYDAMCTP
ncbi:MAG: oxidoreductase, partial [Polyangiaceae bacterium]